MAGQISAAGFEVLRVEHEGMIFGANGVTDYEARTVAVRENMDPAAQVKTLAHELAHVVMHDPDDEEARQHRGTRERVRKTALAILDQLDTLQVGDGTPPGIERDTLARTSAAVKPVASPAPSAEPERAPGVPVLAGRGL